MLAQKRKQFFDRWFYSDLLEYYEKRLKKYFTKSEKFSMKPPRN